MQVRNRVIRLGGFALPLALIISAGAQTQSAPRPRAAQQPNAVPFEFQSLVRGGSFLGVFVYEVDTERAKELGLKDVHGVEVTSLEKDGPADKAGLKVGDIVLDYQGQRIEGTQQFVRMVQETPVGRTVKLNILRGGANQTVSVAIGSRKTSVGGTVGPSIQLPGGNMWIPPDVPRAFTSWRSSVLGVEAETIEGQLAEYFGVKKGLLVRSVMKGSAAEKAGIKAGDVVLKADGEELDSPAELSRALRSAHSKETITLNLMRDHKETSVSVSFEGQAPPQSRRGPMPDQF